MWRKSIIFIGYVVVVVILVSLVYRVVHTGQVDFKKARSLYQAEQYQKSVDVLNDLKSLKASRGKVIRLRGLCQMKLGNDEKALKLFEEYVKDYAPEAQDLKTLLSLYRANHKWQTALSLNEALLKRYPENRELRIAYARTLVGAGDFQEAVEQYRIFLGEKPYDKISQHP